MPAFTPTEKKIASPVCCAQYNIILWPESVQSALSQQ